MWFDDPAVVAFMNAVDEPPEAPEVARVVGGKMIPKARSAIR